MKKLIAFFITFVLLVTLTGCTSEKTLTCDYGDGDVGIIVVNKDEIVSITSNGEESYERYIDEIEGWFQDLGGDDYFEMIENAYDEEIDDGFTCTLD